MGDTKIECVACGYVSHDGLLHYGSCRLMLYEWIGQDGPRKERLPMEPMRPHELKTLEYMITEMEKRGAKRQPDGCFGKCVI